MTMVPPAAAHPLVPALAGRRIEVRWTSTVAPSGGLGAERADLSVVLLPIDMRHVMLEAWIETAVGRRRPLLPRQPVAARLAVLGGMIHADADVDGERVIALSLLAGAADGDRLLYAQTTLLGVAGFAPGACDPPTARMRPAAADAASA